MPYKCYHVFIEPIVGEPSLREIKLDAGVNTFDQAKEYAKKEFTDSRYVLVMETHKQERVI